MTAILPVTAVTAAVSTTSTAIKQFTRNPRHLTAQAQLVGGTSGTSIDAWLQTSIDGEATWIDIAQFHVTNTPVILVVNLSAQTPVGSFTPTDGSMSSNAVKDGIIGSKLKVKWSSVGTYATGTTFTVVVEGDEPITIT